VTRLHALSALAVVVACAASCEVRSDLVFPPGGGEGTGGAPDGAVTPHEAGLSDAPHPRPDAADARSSDARSPDARSPDATPPDAAFADASPRDADADAKPDAPMEECRDDDDCPFYDPRCDPGSRTCVDCLGNDDCDGDDDICDPLLLRCVECVFDADCEDRDQPLCRDSECTER
jgi:hypothetical protein